MLLMNCDLVHHVLTAANNQWAARKARRGDGGQSHIKYVSTPILCNVQFTSEDQ